MRIRRLLLAAATICVSALTLQGAGAESDDPEWVEGRLGPRYYLVCVDKNPTDADACPDGKAVWYESGFVEVDEVEGGVLGFYAQVCYDLNAADGLKCDGKRATWSAGRSG